jgi:5,10-methylene-tetrahydrofolate dehydrogenase/methenyl tetrahydrofolate cyclohydrolase
VQKRCVNNKKLSKMFLVNNDTKAKANFVDASKENIKTQSIKSESENYEVKVKVNRVTDKIEYINIHFLNNIY